jgi:uncharacterized protein
MATDIIRYDLLVQDALRGVVRNVLAESAREGLPGEHHFYITFRTDAPGVRLSTRMREKYPGEMTIVLQHQFWDLNVSDDSFEVGLSFNNIPERLVIPFDAVTGFFDPSVQFGLKFEVQDAAPETGANDTEPARLPAKPEPLKVPKSHAEKTAAKTDAAEAAPARPLAKPAAAPKGATKGATRPSSEDATAKPAPEPAESAPKVVSIDAFRKKT